MCRIIESQWPYILTTFTSKARETSEKRARGIITPEPGNITGRKNKKSAQFQWLASRLMFPFQPETTRQLISMICTRAVADSELISEFSRSENLQLLGSRWNRFDTRTLIQCVFSVGAKWNKGRDMRLNGWQVQRNSYRTNTLFFPVRV